MLTRLEFEQTIKVREAPYYNRSVKRYCAMVTSSELDRQYGHGRADSKPGALTAAIDDAWQTYKRLTAREQELKALEPLRRRVEDHACRELVALGWEVLGVTVDLQYEQIVIRMTDPQVKFGGYESIGLHYNALSCYTIVAEFRAALPRLVERKFKNAMEARLEKIIDRRRAFYRAAPRISPADAAPGDVLVNDRGEFFQVISISPAKAKIMIWYPWGINGPRPVERLPKHEIHGGYMRFTWEAMQYNMMLGQKIHEAGERQDARTLPAFVVRETIRRMLRTVYA